VVLLTLHGSHDELFFKLYNRLPREVPSIRDLLLAGLWRTPGESSSKSARRL
jgi:phosphoenolpyruvate carboxykinase (GTP)